MRVVALALAASALVACGVGDFTFDGRPGIDVISMFDAHGSDAALDGERVDATDSTLRPDASPPNDASDSDITLPTDTPVGADTVEAAVDSGCSAATCSGGTCMSGTCTCSTGMTLCGIACVDTQTDPLNCGVCGAACGATSCSGGHCGCTSGLTNCSGACVDVTTSVANCGSCAHACASGHVCMSGSCVCPAGQLACTDGTCSSCPGGVGGTPACNTTGSCFTACSPGYAPLNSMTCCDFGVDAFQRTTGTSTLTFTGTSYTLMIGGATTGSVAIGPEGAGTITDETGCTFHVTFVFTGTSCDPGDDLTITVTDPGTCSGTSRFAGVWMQM